MKRILFLFTLLVSGVCAFAENFDVDGLRYTISGPGEVSLTNGRGKAGSVDIPSNVEHNGERYSVTSIGFEAFSNNIGLKSVTIPNSVISIDTRAFCQTGLISLTIGNSVTSIGLSAFEGCYYLTSFTIPNSVTSIADQAFNYCFNLTSLTIPNGVTSIGNAAFSRCRKLKVLVCEANVPPACQKGTFDNGTVLYVPSGTKDIYSQADGWKDDFRYTFDGIPEDAYIVEDNILYAPYSETQALVYSADNYITEANIKPEVTINGKIYEVDFLSSFEGCNQLKSVTIPNSVTTIEHQAFSGCPELTSVTIPNSVTSIGNYAFSACRNLTSVIISNNVTSIGEYVFYLCRVLKSVTIPNSVTSIGRQAFEGCTSLTSVSIGDSVNEIGLCAFYDCPSLENIVSLNPVPPTCQNGVFRASTFDTAILTVPENSLTEYQNNDTWRCFYNIVGSDFSGIGSIIAADNLESCVELYNINGQKVYEGKKSDINATAVTPGIYIVRSEDGATRKIAVRKCLGQ